MIKTSHNHWIDLWPFSFGPPDLGGKDNVTGNRKNLMKFYIALGQP